MNNRTRYHIQIAKSLLLLMIFTGCGDKDQEEIAGVFFGEGMENNIIGKSLVYSGYTIEHDSNGNDEINPGETVYIYLYIENNGTRFSKGIKVRLSTQDNNINNLYPSIFTDYGSLYPNEETWSDINYYETANIYYSFSFSVSSSISPGTIILFDLEIEDSDIDVWNSIFQVEIK